MVNRCLTRLNRRLAGIILPLLVHAHQRGPPLPTQSLEIPPKPASLDGHDVPPERLAMILPHVRLLAETARTVSDTLPLQADAADFQAALEAEKE